MVLDYEKSRTFDCHECDYNLQYKRNCLNRYEPAKIILNDELYEQCPKSFLINNRELKFLVDLYFECRDSKTYPEPGTMANQTAFTMGLFEFIDPIVNNYHRKQHQKQMEAINKNRK